MINKKQKTISFDNKKEVGNGDGAKIGNLRFLSMILNQLDKPWHQ